MSSPSKRRRAARAWMQREYNERERLKQDGYRQAKGARADERSRLTQLIPNNDEGVYYPLGKPEHPYLVVAERISLEQSCLVPWHAYAQRIKTYRLRVTQHGLRLPDGQTVMWFGWELCQ